MAVGISYFRSPPAYFYEPMRKLVLICAALNGLPQRGGGGVGTNEDTHGV